LATHLDGKMEEGNAQPHVHIERRKKEKKAKPTLFHAEKRNGRQRGQTTCAENKNGRKEGQSTRAEEGRVLFSFLQTTRTEGRGKKKACTEKEGRTKERPCHTFRKKDEKRKARPHLQ
jgi:hypothetical protein